MKQLLLEFPDADVFCCFDHFTDEQRREILDGRHPKSTHLGRIPFSKRYYRALTLIFYRAMESLDLSGYDLIISSSHAVAKSVRKQPWQQHYCYCHTPMRYVWNMRKTYLEQVPAPLRKLAMHRINSIRNWDLDTADRVDHFIANSAFIGERILTNYGRASEVIHPPVDTQYFQPAVGDDGSPEDEPYYLVVSRLVQYKRIDLIVNAFRDLPDKRLVVIGAGPQRAALERSAGTNVSFLGHCTTRLIRRYMQHAEAGIFAAIEDFGITCVETQACGTAVIAYDFGGYRETVQHGTTGLLYPEQTSAGIAEAIHRMEATREQFDPWAIRQHSLRFGSERFRAEIKGAIMGKPVEHGVMA